MHTRSTSDVYVESTRSTVVRGHHGCSTFFVIISAAAVASAGLDVLQVCSSLSQASDCHLTLYNQHLKLKNHVLDAAHIPITCCVQGVASLLAVGGQVRMLPGTWNMPWNDAHGWSDLRATGHVKDALG